MAREALLRRPIEILLLDTEGFQALIVIEIQIIIESSVAGVTLIYFWSKTLRTEFVAWQALRQTLITVKPIWTGCVAS